MSDPSPSGTRSGIRVVIVDDHALFRQGVRAALGDAVGAREVVLVAEADDIDSGTATIIEHRPDVVLLDLHLTSGSGAEVITAVRRVLAGSTPRFLGLSVSDEPTDVLQLVRAGARGYVTKRINGVELAEAITRVAAGDAVFSPRLAGFVLDAFGGSAPEPDSAATGDAPETAGDPADLDRLSAREREVMQHLARGYTYKEIGLELHISARTVESHTSAVLRKLQLSNRHELTHWAARHNLLG